MTPFVLSTPPPAPRPWNRFDRAMVRVATVGVAAMGAEVIGWLNACGVDIERWGLPVLLVGTAVALSWRPKSPEGG